MRISAGEASVALAIDGYQFPETEPTAGAFDHEPNWLQVRGAVRANGLEWSFLDPCLLTAEAEELLDWLRDVAGGGSPDELCFLEPNLSFAVDASDANGAVLRVTFSLESAPPAASGAPEPVLLELALGDVESAAGEWASEVAAYPIRR
jgi:hypothetical protein